MSGVASIKMCFSKEKSVKISSCHAIDAVEMYLQGSSETKAQKSAELKTALWEY